MFVSLLSDNIICKPNLGPLALLYRLGILHFASIILPSIGADSWEFEDGVNNFWENRPVRKTPPIHLLEDSKFDPFLLISVSHPEPAIYHDIACLPPNDSDRRVLPPLESVFRFEVIADH